jgi:hypothetical protein
VVACYFPRDPKSHSLAAKAHGRVGMAVKALELALSVVYAMRNYFGARERLVSAAPRVASGGGGSHVAAADAWSSTRTQLDCALSLLLQHTVTLMPCRRSHVTLRALQVMCMVFSVLNLGMLVMYLPFYKPAMNIASIVHGAVFAFATLVLALAMLRRSLRVRVPPMAQDSVPRCLVDEGAPWMWCSCARLVFVGVAVQQSDAEAFGFLAMTPAVALGGYVLYRHRYDSLRMPQRVSSPYMVSVHATTMWIARPLSTRGF